MTATEAPAAGLFYDAECSMCTGLARRFERVLASRRIELHPLQTPGAGALLGVGENALLDEMRLRLPDGAVLGGAAAAAEVARRIWWAWPLWALSRLPGAMSPMSAAYRWVARRRSCASGACRVRPRGRGPGVAPLAIVPPLVLLLRSAIPPWQFMWAMAFALYASCKWLTYREALRQGAAASPWRAVGYLATWPGMDAAEFLSSARAGRPQTEEWLRALAKTAAGLAIVSLAARLAMRGSSLGAGWIGMIGVVLVLHFGSFEVLSLVWRRAGVQATPVMQQPFRSTSLSEFWGRRWNTAFHELAARFTFRPLRTLLGAPWATVGVFVVSGLIHELVISVPARGGYGLPTAYFVLQALGVVAERTSVARTLGLGRGVRGWLFTSMIAGAPVFMLFPPVFVRTIVLPMLVRIAAM